MGVDELRAVLSRIVAKEAENAGRLDELYREIDDAPDPDAAGERYWATHDVFLMQTSDNLAELIAAVSEFLEGEN